MKRKKNKPVQFVQISFKLSKQQKRALNQFCKHHGISPIKLIKRSIDRYTSYVPEKNAKPYVHPKQLDIFDTLSE
ncbi:MAG: hypothetical protein LBH92_06465 [Bacteroidales bacterium]|jgi:hypothetical protein|nr:hypothetical protein [Bacteroidales bacterium]